MNRIVNLGLVLLMAAPLCGGALRAAESHGASKVEQQVTDLLNAARREAGVKELTADPALGSAAHDHAAALAKRNETPLEPDEEGLDARIRDAGYKARAVAKSFARNAAGAKAIAAAWLKSPGHRKNILDPELTQIGVGLVEDAGGNSVCVAVMARPERLRTLPAVDAPEPSADELAIIRLTNDERRALGLKELQPGQKLFVAARQHSANMARQKKMAHELDGKTVLERVKALGYKHLHLAENVAENQEGPAEVVAAWMKSPGHRMNILAEQPTEIGVGVAYDDHGAPYYTQVFALPKPPRLDVKQAEAALIALINAARHKAGREDLRRNEKLCTVARAHSANMAKQKQLVHRLDGKGLAERIAAARYKYAQLAENVALDYGGPGPALAQWLNAAGAKGNILSAEMQELGVGLAYNDDNDPYYTLILATPAR
jgi:uncharacterized protein YkwD